MEQKGKTATKTLPHVTQDMCLSCAASGETCCVDMCVPLMVRDLDRICALGYCLEDFATLQDYSDEDADEHEDWWMQSRIEHGGRLYRIVLKPRKNGDCLFLMPGKGCVLGPDRPLTCRMYPYWVSPEGEIIHSDTGCPIIECAPEISAGLCMIKETITSLKKHCSAIAEDCISNGTRGRTIVRRLAACLEHEEAK